MKKNITYGIHGVTEALRSDKTVDKILVKKGAAGHMLEEVIRQARLHDIQVQYVPVEKLNRIAGGNHQGIAAFLSSIEYSKVEEIIPFVFEQGKNPLILVLDGITDVRNFGAIARTAECAGADAIVLPSKGSVSVNADAIKTSAGALHSIPVCKAADIVETLKYMRNSGLTLTGATEKAGVTCFQADYTSPCAIVMGAEDTGLSKPVLKMMDTLVKIPMFGNIGSLNVSVATAVILYEAVRQRNFSAKS
ncbi:MAG: 23S rRNA (guanosine(2251)-2'-O)-methyltransferase RlmB [Bacteroidales bacterium]|nr:23S rRNA (guanosine(2251)-2'-O)-methyltransferase RlmB [Bacteroidales bacterium]